MLQRKSRKSRRWSKPLQHTANQVHIKVKRDDALIDKSMRIQSGQWKGSLGIVSDATATHVHSQQKKVMVVRDRVAVTGDKFGSTEDERKIIIRTHILSIQQSDSSKKKKREAYGPP